MATYLLTWNPSKWDWPRGDFERDIAAVKESSRAPGRWSCGATKRIKLGDRVFLLRQGVEPRGLIASGWVTREPFSDRHWEDAGPLGRQTMYVGVDWDWLSRDPVIRRPELNDSKFAGVNWNTQSTGISVDAEVALEVEREWSKRLGTGYQPSSGEVTESEYWEGATHRVTVNAFERNTAARAKCLEHYGHSCVVCHFNFGETYGPDGEGIIHVHHLVPIGSIGKKYRIDPIADLRPVCPNCHAMIHRYPTPLDPDDLRRMLK